MNEGVSLDLARAAKSHAAKTFQGLLGEEVSVGLVRVGEECFALKVNLTSDPGKEVELPTDVDGVPVHVEFVGRVRKL